MRFSQTRLLIDAIVTADADFSICLRRIASVIALTNGRG